MARGAGFSWDGGAMEGKKITEDCFLMTDAMGVAGEAADRKYFRGMVILCSSWLLIWTLLPAILLDNAYIDVLENVVWGRHFQFGYDKNPYLGAWLTRLGYIATGNCLQISYLLSQLSVLTGFICVWKLARKFMSPAYAFLSVIFLTGVLFYGIKTLEFNDDVIEIALWPLTMLFFYRALVGRSNGDWLLVGLFSGLSFMTKYYGVVLFVPMAVIMLVTVEGRRAFRQWGLYGCIAVFALLSLPNIIWLFQHEFVAIRYAFSRANLAEACSVPWQDHLRQPLRFANRMIPVVIAPLIAFGIIFFRRSARWNTVSLFNRTFVTVLCFGPLVMTLLFSLLTGGELKYSWMVPGFSLLGLFVVMAWQPLITAARLKLFVTFAVVFSLSCMLAFAFDVLYRQPYKKKNCAYENFPGEAVSRDLTELWHRQFGTPVKYVIGEREEACNFAVYSVDLPEGFFSANRLYSPWIDEEDIRRHGAIILWKGNKAKMPGWVNKYKAMADRVEFYPTRNYPRAVKAWFRSLPGNREPKPVPVTFAFIKPESAK